jgi:5-hydroxyisourate hydrolase-like protein (transthyretin family)
MAPLICRVINATGQGIPNIHITLDRLTSNKSGSVRNVNFTETNGFTHFWTLKSETSRSGWSRILEDNDSVNGLLHFHTHWGVIPIEVVLEGGKSHYILVQLFDASTYQVQHFEFITPVAIVQRYGQWSAEEDETLIELKREGFNSQEIYDSRRLDDRSVGAITSRTKALSNRTRHNLQSFAWSHHCEELYSHRPISGETISPDEKKSCIPQSSAPVYKFVLDSHSQVPELQAEPGT